MNPTRHEAARPESGRVLACVQSRGRVVEVIERADRSLAIRMAGTELAPLHWDPADLEDCIHTYLGLVRA